MGIRTAAGILGFRLATATLLFSRRSIASFATSTAIMENKEKSVDLFLCFDDRRKDDLCTSTTVFRSIRLNSYDDCKEVDLLETGNHDGFPVYASKLDRTFTVDKKEILRRTSLEFACRTKIIRLGSEILFTIGHTAPRDICWVDPLTRPLEYHISSQTETNIKSFSTPKSDMRWGVIGDKLYCFDSGPLSLHPFEVLDPKIDQASWQPLSGPPFIKENGGTDRYSALFFNESKKIWGWEDPRYGVYCFDATKPENGWIEAAGFGGTISFISQNDTHLVIHDNHPKLGDFNLMFSYDDRDEPFIISPFFISDNCDSFESISKSIRLPKDLCSEYRLGYCENSNHGRITFGSQFVHLGSKKFCLILHKFDAVEYCCDYRTRGYILVLTFEYDVIVSNETNDSEAPFEINTRMLGTRRFRYYKDSDTEKNDMVGAFSF